jgi:hypothetical protein
MRSPYISFCYVLAVFFWLASPALGSIPAVGKWALVPAVLFTILGFGITVWQPAKGKKSPTP